MFNRNKKEKNFKNTNSDVRVYSSSKFDNGKSSEGLKDSSNQNRNWKDKKKFNRFSNNDNRRRRNFGFRRDNKFSQNRSRGGKNFQNQDPNSPLLYVNLTKDQFTKVMNIVREKKLTKSEIIGKLIDENL